MEQIKIKQNDKEYPVFIGSSILQSIEKFIEDNHKNKKIVIITDDNIKKICENSVLKYLQSLDPYLISIPAGEASKSRAKKQEIEDILLERKYGRDTIIIAFGGGVIGDLAGFVASTFERGIPLIHVPTTLLSMVDSSIGGKTSINTEHGKNLIGTFHQPEAVFTDLNFLDTLSKEEFQNGMAEVIKIATTSDKDLFEFVEQNSEKVIERDKNTLLHIIKRSIDLKKDVVEKDEKESGLRQILNFGHTFGHAFENIMHYKKKHGFCISRGIAVEAKIAVLIGNLKEEKRIISLLERFNLPNKVEKDIDSDKIIEIMKIDKKTRDQKPRFVILNEIGNVKQENNTFSFEVDEDIIKNSIEQCKND
tara:strand:+ start:14909 stop:16000 length:1092 start_codon:yes stop_codon:yes gene_type:complete